MSASRMDTEDNIFLLGPVNERRWSQKNTGSTAYTSLHLCCFWLCCVALQMICMSENDCIGMDTGSNALQPPTWLQKTRFLCLILPIVVDLVKKHGTDRSSVFVYSLILVVLRGTADGLHD